MKKANFPLFRAEIITEKDAIRPCRTFCRAIVSLLGKTCRVGQEKTAGDLSAGGRLCFCFCVSSHLPNSQGTDLKEWRRDVSRLPLLHQMAYWNRLLMICGAWLAIDSA